MRYILANKNEKWAQNKPGKYYVDQACIACDACITTAPDHYLMNDEAGHAFVSKQPEGPAEEEMMKEAMESCPVEAIGNDGE
jgi:ferredoxin